MLIRAGKIAAIIVGTYIAGAFMLGGRDRLRVRLFDFHSLRCSASPGHSCSVAELKLSAPYSALEQAPLKASGDIGTLSGQHVRVAAQIAYAADGPLALLEPKHSNEIVSQRNLGP